MPTRIVDHRCPWCGAQHDAISTPEDMGNDVEVGPGDMGLCFDCGEWGVLGDDWRLRKPTEEEFSEIGLDEDCRITRMAWVAFKEEKERRGEKPH